MDFMAWSIASKRASCEVFRLENVWDAELSVPTRTSAQHACYAMKLIVLCFETLHYGILSHAWISSDSRNLYTIHLFNIPTPRQLMCMIGLNRAFKKKLYPLMNSKASKAFGSWWGACVHVATEMSLHFQTTELIV